MNSPTIAHDIYKGEDLNAIVRSGCNQREVNQRAKEAKEAYEACRNEE
jgi:hypothetical protein